MVGVVVSRSGRLDCVSVQCLVSDGRLAAPLASPTGSVMIDTTTKHQSTGVRLVVGDKEFMEKMAWSGQGKQNHNKMEDPMHLPKNVYDSDEDSSYDDTSEDDNDKSGQEVFIEARDKNKNIDKLEDSFNSLQIDNTESKAESRRNNTEACKAECHRCLKKVAQLISSDLKSRSPFRNKSQSKHNQKPFDRNAPAVGSHIVNVGQVYMNGLHISNHSLNTPVGTGGNVFINPSPRNTPVVSSHFGRGGHHYSNSCYHEHDVLDIKDSELTKDFIFYFNQLSHEDQEQVLLNFTALEQKFLEDGTTLSQSLPVTKCPEMSPTPEYDSSYESLGSPGSSVTPSPGSPYLRHSSESDLELDSAGESYSVQRMNKIIVLPPGQNLYSLNQNRSFTVVPEMQVKPLGEPIPCNRESATERLFKLSKSTSLCKERFTIQLVCVVMKTNAQKASDKFNDFSKSLISLIKQKVANKQSVIDNWQLAIYAHIQFLVAPERMMDYRAALLEEIDGHSLLYTAAMKHNDKPLIARYIAESMKLVGYDLTEKVDEKENSLLHALAKQGDSHCKVLEELVHATSPVGKPLFNLAALNEEQQTPLHVAALTHRPCISTTVFLLQEGLNPLQLDILKNTPLHYQVKRMSSQIPRVSAELGLLKKMLNHAVPTPPEDSLAFDLLSTDPTIPQDILSIIERVKAEVKKNEKH